MNIFAGTSGYGYREWKGTFYPQKISANDMLRSYSSRLNTVEINNTFYRMPRRDLLAGWADQVPPGFIFAVKTPQVITHIKRLINIDADAKYFFQSLSVLGEKLGPILVQFPGSFQPGADRIEAFLDLVPPGMFCAFEFRTRNRIDSAITDLLEGRGHALCIADTDEKPVAEIVSRAGWGYLRLRRSDYQDVDVRNWYGRIAGQHWDRAFVYFKHEGGARGPQLAAALSRIALSAHEEQRRAS